MDEVERFSTLAEARVAIAYLRSREIDASLADAHTLSVLIGGISSAWYRVLAPRDQVGEARRLLGAAQDARPEEGDDDGS
jgi:hypothetical protein